MAWEERGIATAMSLGGKAQRIAMVIPQAVLAQRNGLSILLNRLEHDLGAEIQDRVRHAGKAFNSFKRPKGQNAAEFVVAFEALYAEAVGHGMWLNRTLLTQHLIDAAGLSEAQEQWCLGQVGADYSNYEGVRRALRRLPALDTRHNTDTGMWFGNEESPEHSGQSHSHSQHGLLESSRLQHAPPEYNAPPAEASYPTGEIDDTESFVSDDYCSTGSGEDEADQQNVQHAWLFHRRARKKGARKGGKHRRKGGKKGKGGTWLADDSWLADNKRNSSSDIPPGWNASDWLKRSECPGCGSRFHRNCTSGGKGSKGGGKKGKGPGKSGYANFMLRSLVAATCIANAAGTLFSDSAAGNTSLSFAPPAVSSTAPHTLVCHNVPQQACYHISQCIHGAVPWDLDHDDAWLSPPVVEPFCGLEPFEDRESRYCTYVARGAKQRFGLLLDTGAPKSAAGREWIDRYVQAWKLEEHVEWKPHDAQLYGIGEGSASCKWKPRLPIALDCTDAGNWLETQALDGIGRAVPSLLGLESMIRMRALIDLSDPTNEGLYFILL